jgi:uncharacterized protein
MLGYGRKGQPNPIYNPSKKVPMPLPPATIRRREALTSLACLCVFGLGNSRSAVAQTATSISPAPDLSARLIAAARDQIGVTTRYDPAYTKLAFPNGDVPRDKGVCTDVVIRAYRDAFGIDLQALVNADMRANFEVYPRNWNVARPDPSIDHRRVLNLQVFMKRRGAALVAPKLTPDLYQPGELVTQRLPPNLPHIGIVSDRRAPAGHPLVLHNIGAGTEESDVLPLYPLIGRYRLLSA